VSVAGTSDQSAPADPSAHDALHRQPLMPDLLIAALNRNLDKPAVYLGDTVLTARQVRDEISRYIQALESKGLGRGSPVAILALNRPEVLFNMGAGMLLGCRSTPLHPMGSLDDHAYVLEDAGIETLVYDPEFFGERAAQLAERVPGLKNLLAFGPSDAGVDYPALASTFEPRPLTAPDVRPEDVPGLAYTGGTTGKPKGAMLSHANLSAACSIYKAWGDPQRITEPGGDKIICVLPLFHIFALTNVLLRGLQEGNELLLRARFDVATTLADIEVKRATVFLGVPTMWIALANTPDIDKRDFTSLRYVGSGGAALPVEAAERFQKLTGQRLGGGWGMTETAPAGTAMPREWTGKAGSVGLPLPGIMMDVVALDDPRRVLPPGTKGEIRIKGPNVTQGYWNAPAETAAAFVDGYLLTGDIGFMDEDGYFYLVDRKKDMIISGGFNVYPRTIEEAIYEHPAVAEAVVIGVPDAYRGEAAKAFVQLKAGAVPFSLDELRAFLADKLARHEMPADLEFREALPKTAVGKLSKQELLAEERRKTRAAAE
jgi:long-chain acyl-CoA synthetase